MEGDEKGKLATKIVLGVGLLFRCKAALMIMIITERHWSVVAGAGAVLGVARQAWEVHAMLSPQRMPEKGQARDASIRSSDLTLTRLVRQIYS